MSILLSLFLVLTPQPSIIPIYEDIHLAGDLSVRAESLPLGGKSSHEGMLLSVEDFILIRTELELTTEACDSRIDDLVKAQQQQIHDMQVRCERQFTSINLDLDKANVKIERLELDLERTQRWRSIYKWATFGLTAALVGTGTYILIK